MKYLDSPFNDAYANMALEEYLLTTMAATDEFFVLWQNTSAVVVGRCQNTLAEINKDYAEKQGIQVVRRLSGGGAMYQDLGNLNFTFIVRPPKDRDYSFDYFTKPIIDALLSIGIVAIRSGRNDIVIDGKKISGNAQYRKGDLLLHHGTLLFDSQLEVLTSVLNPHIEKLQTKGIASVASRVTNIKPYLKDPLTLNDLKIALIDRVVHNNLLTSYQLTEEDCRQIGKLQTDKYTTWQWNWGRSPGYERQKTERFPFGTVEVSYQIKGGCINKLQFFGDFFSDGDPDELAELLIGCSIEKKALELTISEIEVDRYIVGLQAADLLDLLSD